MNPFSFNLSHYQATKFWTRLIGMLLQMPTKCGTDIGVCCYKKIKKKTTFKNQENTGFQHFLTFHNVCKAFSFKVARTQDCVVELHIIIKRYPYDIYRICYE